MSFQDLLEMAVKNLGARKLRTFLTLLGVIIGTISVVVMISFGIGMQDSNRKFIESMGDMTILEVHPGISETGAEKKITKASIKEIEQVDHIAFVSPVYQNSFSMQFKKYRNDYAQVTAMDEKAFSQMKHEFEEGGSYKDNTANYDMVFGGQVANNFYSEKGQDFEPEFDENGQMIDPPPPFDANGSTITLSAPEMDFGPMGPIETSGGSNAKVKAKVAGVLEKTGGYMDDLNIYMGIDTYKAILKELKMPQPAQNTYEQLKVKVDDMEYARDVEQEIKAMGYDVFGLFSMMDEMNSTMKIVSAIFGGIGAISFIVAAIGITNTMIMSIYERTREIGVMKVIGASIDDIQKIFLVESGLIGLMGGFLGLILSLLISFGINQATLAAFANQGMEETTKVSIIPPWLLLSALVFTFIVGVISGYLPAQRAMKLSALEAIRTD